MPLVSVVMPAFNHAEFISRSIESILKQTERDFELIVVDDRSADDTVSEIKKFSDPRIKLICHEYNKGCNAAMNSAFAAALGDYVVFTAGDDMLYPHHLETSVGYLREHPETDVFYCLSTAVDENDEEVSYFNGWQPPTNDKAETLRALFSGRNVLLSPGMTIRKRALEHIYPAPQTMLGYQDYRFHICLLTKANYYFSNEYLVYYRRFSNGKNLSTLSPSVMNRANFETEMLMDAFLEMSAEQVSLTFSDELATLGIMPMRETVPFALGRLALKSKDKARRAWGYHVLMRFLASEENFDLVHQLYGFDFKRFMSLASFEDDVSEESAAPVRPKGLEKLFYKLYKHFSKKRRKKEAKQ